MSPLTDGLLSTLAARVCSSTSDTYTTVEVFTGGPLATLPESSVADVHTAYERVGRAQRVWAALPLDDRLAVFHRFHKLLLRERETMADLLQAETGKARRDAFEELSEPALVTSYYLRSARRLLRPRKRAGLVPGAVAVRELRQPKGVVGIISPWNYPFALSFGDLVPALVAGNGVVLKPDSQTALSPLFGAELLYRAGLPVDLLAVVLGDGPGVGGAIVDTCDYIGFTGSSRTGALIAAQAGARLVGCSLELGGKNPLIVLDDADIAATARSAVRGCFANAGQLCLSLERVYVPEGLFDRFAATFVDEVELLRQGAGYGYEVDVGSLSSQRALKTVSEHVDDARAKGATVLVGGRPRPDLGPFFYEPTVLTGVTPEMSCFMDETFGPVVSLYSYSSVDDAVALANDTAFGLNASVYGRDVVRAGAVAARLRVGSANVNDGYASAFGSTDAPMGGMGASGLGRRHGAEGLLRYTEVQAVAVKRVEMLNPPRWVPYRVFSKSMAATLRVMKALRLR
ncbi:succinic semialdehyde dehydrogenase [Actinophytocola oryzae]|uniref:Aldehyde dehydrogenase (NAD+)/succinate-semialdehyde dehydrogenase/glutarate-semialdehyde dehydrogenase n=1 Tax=Actinophytocola oryzae TaxID=502181 RepID=A0A4R7UYY7_9PSEU|nr:succinic semialdehyde dehydrogenase [Actinophytocola oryzae]TDV41750.1 aldehyde dehydrogenase (NAD+)/succinate-semialdehyde dehydrogenase/glutarate-semialdehyde dehydrogenase [Actinophytocola oryzae]